MNKVNNSAVLGVESDRNNLISSYYEELPEIMQLQADSHEAFSIMEKFNNLNISSKLEQLDAVAFISIDVESKTNSRLFGEISEIIESAIATEVLEIKHLSEESLSRHATPDIIISSTEYQMKNILNDSILREDSEKTDDFRFAVRYMETYNEMANSAIEKSEKTSIKESQNNEFISFIGAKMRPTNTTEGQIGDIMNYTIAVVSNIKDGTMPDVNLFKERVTDSINDGITSLATSQNLSQSINVFKDLNEALTDCIKTLKETECKDKYIDAVSAIKEICEKQQEMAKSDVFEM